MCTSIIEIARADGMAKRGDEWFPLTQAVVAYDHARHAPLGDVITLDFINTDLEPSALGARLGDALVRLDRRLVALAFDRLAALQVGKLELGRLAEKLVPARFHHRHELLAEAARIAVRGQRRVHVIADGLFA